MIVHIKDKEYTNENYKCIICINGTIFDNWEKTSKQILIPCKQGDFITIEFINIIFEETRSYFLILLYWCFALISGYGEKNPFGYPFNTIIEIKNLEMENSNVYVISNSIWEKLPFRIEGSVEVMNNIFYSSKTYKKKWLLGMVIPMYFLLFLVLLMLSMVNVTIYLKILFLLIPISAIIWWTNYTIKINKKLSNL